MKTYATIMTRAILIALTATAGNAATSTIDGGGQRSTSANYTMDGSGGGIGDDSAGGGITLKPGFVGQLTEVTNLASGVWTNLPGCVAIQGQAGQMSLTDTNSMAVRFYRVEVRVP